LFYFEEVLIKYTSMMIILLSAITLSGCIYVNDSEDGRHSTRSVPYAQPTVGQELLDLEQARESGVINNTEYEQAKEAILAENS